MTWDMYQKLLDDDMYKQLTKGLSYEEKEQLNSTMKQLMENLEDGFLAPVAKAMENPSVKEQLKKMSKERPMTIGDVMKAKKNG